MNHIQLGNLIKQKRTREGMTLRQAAKQSGVDASRLNRIERGIGHTVTSGNLKRLLVWLGYTSEGAVATSITQPLPDVVSEILASDPALTGDNTARLTMLFRNAYEAMTA